MDGTLPLIHPAFGDNPRIKHYCDPPVLSQGTAADVDRVKALAESHGVLAYVLGRYVGTLFQSALGCISESDSGRDCYGYGGE